jgi:hypothetical protein
VDSWNATDRVLIVHTVSGAGFTPNSSSATASTITGGTSSATGTVYRWGGMFCADRVAYVESETVVVSHVDAGDPTRIVLQNPLRASYTIAQTSRSLMAPTTTAFHGGRYVGLPTATGDAKNVGAIVIRNGHKNAIDGLDVFGFPAYGATVHTSRGLKMSNVDIECLVPLSQVAGLQYGLTLAGVEDASINASRFVAARHGVAHGGQTTVCRDIRFSNCYIAAQGQSVAFDFHGNAEDCSLTDCVISGGLGTPPHRITLTACTFLNGEESTAKCWIDELTEWNGLPNWHQGKTRIRDESAQAAGY